MKFILLYRIERNGNPLQWKSQRQAVVKPAGRQGYKTAYCGRLSTGRC